MKTAIGFLTKDRVELSKQSIEPLHNGQHALFWFDGSDTKEGEDLPAQYATTGYYVGVRGGPGAAIVFALHTMLSHPANYTHVGLAENDVLLDANWFEPTMELFDNSLFEVGAVSARSYEDRILIQRDSFAVMHNVGAGMIVFTREAAILVLNTFRSGWTLDNIRIFERLSGIDISEYWAFGKAMHWTTADWHWEAMLAAHGYATVALTPSKATMIGQDPPLAKQGLTLVTKPVDARRNDAAFVEYAMNLDAVRKNRLDVNVETLLHHNDGVWTIFPNQIGFLGGSYDDKWQHFDRRLFTVFLWESTEPGASFTVPLRGPCSLLMSGGETGGTITVLAGEAQEVSAPAEGSEKRLVQINVANGIGVKNTTVTCSAVGMRFYAISTREPQVMRPCDMGAFMVGSKING